MGDVVDLGYSFNPVAREVFDERLRMIRVVHRKRLEQRFVDRYGRRLGTVFLVDGDPVAFYGVDGQHYVRCT